MKLATVQIGADQWSVAVAQTASELSGGLSGYESIPAGTGMLLDLGESREVTITTVPMLFDIDILFISSSLEVVDIVSGATPGNEYEETTPVRYVLEVNSGEASSVSVGDTVTMSEFMDWPGQSTISQLMPDVTAIAVLGLVSAMGLGVVRMGKGDAAKSSKYLVKKEHRPTSLSKEEQLERHREYMKLKAAK